VKVLPLLATPPTVTTTVPVVAPVGTGTTMLVALQVVAVAAVPLNLTVLVPCVAPKFAPVIVTDAPTNPEVGFKLVMLGAGAVTVKLLPLLATPPTVTTTVPVVAPVGTGTTMLVALQVVAVAAVPLNLTVLVPCVAPKFAPVIVTDAPTNPEVGFKLVMLGAGTVTVKLLPLLATPPTVTTTVPVVAPVGTGTTMLVALQVVAVAAVPLNLTVLVPCVAPKFAPVIVTLAPTNPEVGFKLVMLGAGAVTVTLAEAVFVGSATETADTLNDAGLGTEAGAVYSPLAEMVPKVGVPPVTPLTCQETPWLEGSLLTVAVNCCCVVTGTEADVGLMVTEMGTGVALMEMIAGADFELSAMEVAVSVTLAGVGTAAGAV